MLMQALSQISFPDGTIATAQYPQTTRDLKPLLGAIGLKLPRPVIVLVGGASGLRHYHIARLHHLFVKVLAPLAERLGAVVVDGGTDCGIMSMMGIARSQTRSRFPLLGVAPVGVISLPGEAAPAPDAAPLEPNHTHFLLVPGSTWGDDSPWIANTATTIAQGMPSITVLINGGEVTWQDATASIKADRPIVAIAGSGRTADVLAAALQGDVTDPRASAIVTSNLLQAVSLEQPDTLSATIQQMFSLQ
jgi:hypothetical protein